MNPGHQPERFEVYEELQDGTGFKLKGNSHLFLYDRYGGWFDQYDNYYNENGQPDDPPSSQSYSQSQRQSLSSASSDEFEREYGRPQEFSDEDEVISQGSERIATNLLNLEGYPQKQYLRVYFHNLPFQSRKEEVLKAYQAAIDNNIGNVILQKDQFGKNIGTGYFVVQKEIAERLVKLQGQKLLERSLSFQVQEFETFLLFPLKSGQIQGGTERQKPKKYVLKNAPKEEEKKEKIEIKWKWYKFDNYIFPKKASFNEWMSQNGFNFNEDFKNIEKIVENDRKLAKIEMKQTVFNAINRSHYGDRIVQFTEI